MKKFAALILTFIMLLSVSAMAEVTDPLANEVGVTPIVKEGEKVTLVLGIKQNANVTDYEDNWLTKEWKKRTGVDIEFMFFPSTDAETKLDLMVASGEKLPDIITFAIDDNTRRYNYGSSGAILPMEEYYERLGAPVRGACEEYGIDMDFMLKQLASPDGHVYAAAINRDDNYANYPSLRAFINKTWLDKLNLQVPTTSQELYDVLVAFRDQDPNGNGEKDEIPLMGCDKWWQSQALGYLQNMFIYYNNDESYLLPLNETDGKLDVAYDKDEYREFLKYANKLVSDGLLSTLSFTQDATQMSSFMLSKPSVVGMFVAGPASNLYWGNIDDEYIPFEVCAGPEGVQYQTYNQNNPSACCAISADCEHPEIAFMFLEYCYYNFAGGDENSMDLYYGKHWGERGVDWDYAEPGTLGMFSDYGFDARLVVHNKVWGAQTNKNYNNVDVMMELTNAPSIMEAWDGNKDNDEYQYAVNYGLNAKHMPSPENIVPALTYTQEETEQWNDLRTTLKAYIAESRTLFAMGQLDPNSDADWNAYLEELNNQQYKALLAVDQAAYDRVYGSK